MPDVRDSFSKVAANYSKSTFHASSVRLQEVVDLVRPKRGDLALDVATGTGNTALAVAPHVRRVVGLDLTREMLNEARRVAAERSITNVDWVIGDAAHLPFQDGTFDIYVVRAAPHHFTDVDAFLGEAFRVLKPDRDAAFVDCAPPLPARDVLLEVESAQARELDWNYEDWMGNMSIGGELSAELAAVIEAAEGEAREQLHPERRDGKLFHAYWHALIRAHKPDG